MKHEIFTNHAVAFILITRVCLVFMISIFTLLRTWLLKKILYKVLWGVLLCSYGSTFSVKSAKLIWFVADLEEQANVKKLLSQFEKSYPKKKNLIQIQFELDHHYQGKIQELLEEAPDLITLQNGYVTRGLLQSGLLQDVQDIWVQNNLNNIYASAINSVSLGNRIYGVPISYQDPIVFLYRKSLVKKYQIHKLPSTWEALQKICQTLVDIKQIPIMTGLSDEQGGWMWLQALLPGVLSLPELLSLMTQVEKPAERLVEILDILDTCRNSHFWNKDAAEISYQDALYRFVEKQEGVFFLAKRSALLNFSLESQQDLEYFFLPSWNQRNQSTAFMSVKSLFCFKTGYQKPGVQDFLRFISRKKTIRKFHKDLFYKMSPETLNFLSLLKFWNPDQKKQYFYKKSKRFFINDLKKELPQSLYQSMRIFVLRNILQKSGMINRTLDEEWNHHIDPHKQ